MRSKGKREVFVCGDVRDETGGLLAARVKATRLDRDATETNAAWAELMRGQVVVVEPALALLRPRVSNTATVFLVESR